MTKNDINDLYLDVMQNVQERGEIKAKRREIIFLTFTLTDMDKNILFFPFAQRNWPWILRETSDRIFNVSNPGTAFKYSKNWENRIEESGYFSYHYANRLSNQMKDVLSKRTQSRDKIVQVWKPGDYNLSGRQPCTITMQPVMESDNKISLIVYMRNNDMVNIFPSDIFIHSTYFKYWAAYHGLEYKNLYWVAAVAYYQKKRDELKFVERLISQWSDNYNGITPTLWTKDLVEQLALKEQFENQTSNLDFESQLSSLSIPYVNEWYRIMLLAQFKKQLKKDEFEHVSQMQWQTEFGRLKSSITPPR